MRELNENIIIRYTNLSEYKASYNKATWISPIVLTNNTYFIKIVCNHYEVLYVNFGVKNNELFIFLSVLKTFNTIVIDEVIKFILNNNKKIQTISMFVLNKCEINYFKNNIFTFGNPICYKHGIKIDNEIFDLYQYYSLNSL